MTDDAIPQDLRVLCGFAMQHLREPLEGWRDIGWVESHTLRGELGAELDRRWLLPALRHLKERGFVEHRGGTSGYRCLTAKGIAHVKAAAKHYPPVANAIAHECLSHRDRPPFGTGCMDCPDKAGSGVDHGHLCCQDDD